MGLFKKKIPIDFSKKTDAQVLKLFNSLEKEKQDEILDFLGKQVIILPIVARQQGLSLGRMNLSNRKDNTLLEKYYGIATYDEMKRIYSLISKK
jgi:hypothetical protein